MPEAWKLKNMSIWNKVLVGLICVAALGFWYFSMRTLKTHKYWRDVARKMEQELDRTTAANVVLAEGDEKAEAKGIRWYQEQITKLVAARERGRVWSNCEPRNFNPQTGQCTIVTDQPNPNGITLKGLLYVFEEKEADAAGKGGRYLGEFEVEALNENQVQVKPTMKLSPRQLQIIAQASKPWIVFEKMPLDDHEMIASLSEDEKKKMLPADSVASYMRDGADATWEQMEQWGVKGTLVDETGKPLVDGSGKPIPNAKGKFVRQLHDYNAIFRLRSAERTLLADKFEALKRDIQYMQASANEAQRQVENRTKQIATLKADQATVRKERDAVVAHFKTLQAQAKAIEDKVQELLAQNKVLSEQIARMQYDAQQRVDARTRAMAQAREGGE